MITCSKTYVVDPEGPLCVHHKIFLGAPSLAPAGHEPRWSAIVQKRSVAMASGLQTQQAFRKARRSFRVTCAGVTTLPFGLPLKPTKTGYSQESIHTPMLLNRYQQRNQQEPSHLIASHLRCLSAPARGALSRWSFWAG